MATKMVKSKHGMNTALQKAELSNWKEKIVGFGSDGAAVMVGRVGGVTTLLRADVPHLINIQCLGHVLELAAMDAMKGNDRLKKVMDVLKALYKQYHYSPKAWRELKELVDVLHQKIWKPTNLGGTSLSLKLQEDGLTLPESLHAFETAVLKLIAMETEPGEHVEGFLAQTGEGSFHNVQLVGFGERREVFSRVKKELLSSVVASLQHRFQGVEFHRVLLAASRLVDPREWPADQQELASYGIDHLSTVTEHFADVLDRMGCDQVKAKRIEWPSAKVIIKSLPQSLQQNAWQDFFVDDERRKTFCNLLLIVELILVMPLSTASVERGFSAMKRIKTDWRSNLSLLHRFKMKHLRGICGPQFRVRTRCVSLALGLSRDQ
ncbi:Zinc finger protein 862 [Collichthys lucidus]|uniref:Zinc finger protein 862 n=1 Tax=Collichthys lucidus TaxID=240159 RepID=A0A4U5UC38_COLLU|nr:Zinc finger protein 862 [Collichthys lucidus]